MRWLLAVSLTTTATYAIRLTSTRLTGRRLPPGAQRGFRLAAVALLAALVVSNLPTERTGGSSVAAWSALSVSILIARRRSSAALVMGLGAAVYGVLSPWTG